MYQKQSVVARLLLLGCLFTVVSCQWKSSQSLVNGGGFQLSPSTVISGAVVKVVPHPTKAGTLFAVSTNGGIWRTDNANLPNNQIVWTPLTDTQRAHSFGTLVFDKSDDTFQTIYAGPAKLSSYAGIGGDLPGLFVSTNSGNSWKVIPLYRNRHFQDLYVNKNVIIGCHRTVPYAHREDPGETVQVPINQRSVHSSSSKGKRQEEAEKIGLTRGGYTVSDDNGQTLKIDNDGSACHSLEYNPATNTIFLALESGVVYSNDNGVTWESLTTNGEFNKPSNTPESVQSLNIVNVKVHFSTEGKRLWVLIAYNPPAWNGEYPGSLEKLFYIDWPSKQATEIPMPIVYKDYKYPVGDQAFIHAAVLSSPDGQSVIVAGARQPTIGADSPNPMEPESWGSMIFEYSLTTKAWSPLSFDNTKSRTTPHSDCRSLAWALDGSLLESDDGGIVRRPKPFDSTTDWEPITGNLIVLETHSLDLDAELDQVVAGAQDNGDFASAASGSNPGQWKSVFGGDGAPPRFVIDEGVKKWYIGAQEWYVAVSTINPDGSARYLSLPTRLLNGQTYGMDFRPTVQFSPFNPKRIAFINTRKRNLLESMDGGNNLRLLETFESAQPGNFVYGGKKAGASNPDLLIYRSGDVKSGWSIKRRLSVDESPIKQFGSALAFEPTSIVADPDDYSRIWVLTGRGGVMHTDKTDPAPSDWIDWSSPLMRNQIGVAQTIMMASDMCSAGSRHLIALGSTGLFVTDVTVGASGWKNIAEGLPKTYYYDMVFSSNPPLFYLATLGRGIWKLENVKNYICAAPIVQTADVETVEVENDYSYGGDELIEEQTVYYKWGLYANQTGSNFTSSFWVYNGDAYICVSFNASHSEDPCADPNVCEFDIPAPESDLNDDVPEVNVSCRIPRGADSVYMSVTDLDDEDIGTYFDYEIRSLVIAAKDEPFILPAPPSKNGRIQIVVPGNLQQIVYYALPPGLSGQVTITNTSEVACLYASSGQVPNIDSTCVNQLSFATGNNEGYIGVLPLVEGDIFITVSNGTSTTSAPTTRSPTAPPTPTPSTTTPAPTPTVNGGRTIININFAGMFVR
eukprot:TRINITY_DN6283_c0_g1_i1.p1 TRINITY_DN6283_c0_g1~~TRINITY_DN6283_c0_g1_i1.p1  ORF type:complete len:1076 (+),score=278.12 TRINITY_DN6283_c0_g1_i1:94-3321(+)